LYATHFFDVKKCQYYLGEVLSNASLALEFGKYSKSVEWTSAIQSTTLDSIKFYFEAFKDEVFDSRCNSLSILMKNQNVDFINYVLNAKLSEIFFKESELANDGTDDGIKASFKYINECSFHYREASKFYERIKKETIVCHDYIYFLNEFADFADDIDAQFIIIEGYKYKRRADLRLDKCINGNKLLNFDLVCDIIDLYRDAIYLIKEHNIEIEAQILSQIGFIYDKVLNMQQEAKKNFYNCFNLAEAMKPKLFTNSSWYIRCTNAMKKFQDETVHNEEEIKKQEKAKVWDEIKDDIATINAKSKSLSKKEFLEFVYKTYPPKNKSHTFTNTVTNAELKKSFQKGMIHYHPDKNQESKHGKTWYFISEEICKLFGKFYEEFKSVD
jgi:hypothetical protein